MKNTLTLVIITFIFFRFSYGQESKLWTLQEKKIVNIQDTRAKKDYTVQVFLPKDYNKDQKYPVIYFFDADNALLTNFYISTIDALTYYNNMPKSIIIGVNQQHREQELGIYKSASSVDFLNFVRTTLKDTIDDMYATIGYNSYIGHSLGGQLLTYGMINYPEEFYSVMVFSPALLYPDSQKIFDQKIIEPLKTMLVQKKDTMYYYCAVGDSGFQDRQFIQGVKEVEGVIQGSVTVDLNAKFEYLQGYTHAISPYTGLSKGLLFLFKDWGFSEDLAIKILLENSIDGLQALNDRLKKIKANYRGSQIALPQMVYNNLYDYYEQKTEYGKAIEVLKLQLEMTEDKEIYTKIANCYKQIGDLENYKNYLKKGSED